MQERVEELDVANRQLREHTQRLERRTHTLGGTLSLLALLVQKHTDVC
jgi:hypothetical protein